MDKIDNSLVNDIYYNLSNNIGDLVPYNNDILKRIKENIKIYGNESINNINEKHSWVKIENPHISNIKFIYTKGYDKFLKEQKKIEEINTAEYKRVMVLNEAWRKGFTKTYHFPILKTYLDTPWKNILILKAYRCLLTKSIGFTYYVKNTYMIKPFNIIRHDWELTEVSSIGNNYVCKLCQIPGIKSKGMPSGEIFPTNDFMLSCNEYSIKKILE